MGFDLVSIVRGPKRLLNRRYLQMAVPGGRQKSVLGHPGACLESFLVVGALLRPFDIVANIAELI